MQPAAGAKVARLLLMMRRDGFSLLASNVYWRAMRRRGNDPSRDGDAATVPTLPDHLERIQGYLRRCGLLAFPGTESPLRRQLADFMEAHCEETVRIWATTVGHALEIDADIMDEVSDNM